MGRLTLAGVVIGLGELAFCVGALAIGRFVESYDMATLQTLAFLAIVCGNQATTYNNRERRRIWSSRPSVWLIASSLADTSLASVLAVAGIAMSPLSPLAVAALVVAAIVFAFLMDFVKVAALSQARLRIAIRAIETISVRQGPLSKFRSWPRNVVLRRFKTLSRKPATEL